MLPARQSRTSAIVPRRVFDRRLGSQPRQVPDSEKDLAGTTSRRYAIRRYA
ncbi:hypothetical protein [Baaleninema sp.]|uniref:hypothetical protein n=1 Tax=Baaleninema sp. TaxID=3101197 RepID=UPI003D05D607